MPGQNEQKDKSVNSHTPYAPLILAEQVRQLYTIAPIGFVASLLNSLLVFFVTKSVMSYPVIATWLASIWIITLLRMGLVVWFRSIPFETETAILWKRRFLISLVLTGAAWGSIGLFPLAEASLAHQVFLAFVLGGMAAGASSTYSMVKSGYAAYTIPALLPLAIHFILLNDDFHFAMAAMVFLFGGLLWRISLHNYSVNRTSLLLRFENQEMIHRLKAAKEHAEGLNKKLVAEIDAKLSAEAELRQYHEHLERIVEERTADLSTANRELEQFAYVASHDLKAPLRAIANLALIIDEDASERLEPENRRHLKLMRERVRRMDDLIEGMLTYARLGQPAAGRDSVALDDLLNDLLADLPLPADFDLELQQPLPRLNADPLHVRQIFQNLINNAVQHHDRPIGHVWVRARDAGEHWHLEVVDDGPGIPEKERQQVFRMFATGSKEAHTGIGLAVVRKLVLGYGGQVEALPNHPRGTVIRITWPK
ncbi:sensor histidine kinase [Thiohalomonas denitrificans]|uniref:histidine kinase n=1 Tax=Thiohalomonas denitrificans TaxID=415747 RepID=A0A1G5QBN4_9GAMM|nr:HAMP domain-containing sensor histidine kinase [Thiohalomonas denitrificans]SCZ59273.1 Signal transduction histidine kinase [Thiohalomonas denitrificans]